MPHSQQQAMQSCCMIVAHLQLMLELFISAGRMKDVWGRRDGDSSGEQLIGSLHRRNHSDSRQSSPGSTHSPISAARRTMASGWWLVAGS